MPFRESFDCLWCGRPWTTRSAEDLEGWAQLCPDCLGRADENGFLRARLRGALRARGADVKASASEPDPVPSAEPAPATEPEHDDWYMRRGRFARGPLHDEPWLMELDEATRWLDAVPMRGTIVELGAGTGWWSPLLAGKGELWCFEAHGPSLDAARRRLVAHGLVAHLHERDPLAPPDREVDFVFSACFLGAAATPAALAARLEAIRGWLMPGGSFVFVEARSEPGAALLDGPAGPLWPRAETELRSALRAGGLEPLELTRTPNAFLMGRAVRPA